MHDKKNATWNIWTFINIFLNIRFQIKCVLSFRLWKENGFESDVINDISVNILYIIHTIVQKIYFTSCLFSQSRGLKVKESDL